MSRAAAKPSGRPTENPVLGRLGEVIGGLLGGGGLVGGGGGLVGGGGGVVGGGGLVQFATAAPTTATALPQTLTGTWIGAHTWLPLPIRALPEVVPPGQATLAVTLPDSGEEPAVAPPSQEAVADASIAATALPQTLTGTWIGAHTWLPLATPMLPEVVPPEQVAPSPFAVAPPSQEEVAAASTAATELPQTLTGTWIGALTWLPLRAPALTELVPPPAPEVELVAFAPPTQWASAIPMTATALPQTLTGIWMGRTIWLPLSRPMFPLVLPVPDAALAPAVASPPASTAATMPRRSHLVKMRSSSFEVCPLRTTEDTRSCGDGVRVSRLPSSKTAPPKHNWFDDHRTQWSVHQRGARTPPQSTQDREKFRHRSVP